MTEDLDEATNEVTCECGVPMSEVRRLECLRLSLSHHNHGEGPDMVVQTAIQFEEYLLGNSSKGAQSNAH